MALVFAVATPLLAPDGALIAAISATVDASQADRLDDIGEELMNAVATISPKYGLAPHRAAPGEQPVERPARVIHLPGRVIRGTRTRGSQ